MRTSAEELALKVLELLRLQRMYSTGRDPNVHRQIIRLEIETKRLAEAIVHPEQTQPTLFEE